MKNYPLTVPRVCCARCTLANYKHTAIIIIIIIIIIVIITELPEILEGGQQEAKQTEGHADDQPAHELPRSRPLLRADLAVTAPVPCRPVQQVKMH